MYDIKLKKDNRYIGVYHYTTKNEAGQILYLEFLKEETNKHTFYYVLFHIGKRKKGYQFMETTGKDGLKSLLWAKACIKDFIEQVNGNGVLFFSDKIRHTIIIRWDDIKRQAAYYRWLKSLRFYYGIDYRKKCLMYNIK